MAVFQLLISEKSGACVNPYDAILLQLNGRANTEFYTDFKSENGISFSFFVLEIYSISWNHIPVISLATGLRNG